MGNEFNVIIILKQCCHKSNDIKLNGEDDVKFEKADRRRNRLCTETSDLEKAANNVHINKEFLEKSKENATKVFTKEALIKRKKRLSQIVNKTNDLTLKVLIIFNQDY